MKRFFFRIGQANSTLPWSVAALVLLGLLSCCSGSDDASVPSERWTTDPVAVSIEATSVSPSENPTRAGGVGQLNLSTLQTTGYGFGVFSYHTAASLWGVAGSSTTPNFMYNQQVAYSQANKAWEYEPLKYWPNSNQPADASGATGSQPHSYLSFFAYAPYVGTATLGNTDYFFSNATGRFVSSENAYYDAQPAATGILDVSGNAAAGAPSVHFRTAADLVSQVDLLRAAATDQFKYDDDGIHTEGNVGGHVTLDFTHALCQINVQVQRVYNEKTPSSPALHPDNASDTKIFVGSVSIATTGLYQDGWLNLADGTWTWGGTPTPQAPFVYTTPDLNLPVQGTPIAPTTPDNITRIRVYELNKWNTRYHADGTVHSAEAENTEVAGVTETPRQLNLASRTAMLIPTGAAVTLTPTITYSFVTHDNSLELDYLTDANGDRYSRVLNTVTGAPITFSSGLQAGKCYTLLCRIGVESVEFEVASVEDWDFPLRFSPTVEDVEDFTSQTISHTVNEVEPDATF